MTYKSFLEFINEEGESIGGTAAVDASPAPIANTTKNFVNPNNKKLMPSILRRPKAKTIGNVLPDSKPDIPESPKPDSDNTPSLPSIKQTPPKLGVNPPKIKTSQKYS